MGTINFTNKESCAMIRLSERDGFRNLRFKERLKTKGGIIYEKSRKTGICKRSCSSGRFCGCAVRSLCIYERNRLCAFQRCMLKKGKSGHLRISGDRIFLCLGFCGRGEKFLCGFRKIFHGRGNPFLPVIKNKQIHFDIKCLLR